MEQENRRTPGLDVKTYGPEDCEHLYRPPLEGRVIVIDQEALPPGRNTGWYQLWLCLGGQGSARDRVRGAVRAVSLSSGEEISWNRCEVEGILRLDMLPAWAEESLLRLNAARKGEAH